MQRLDLVVVSGLRPLGLKAWLPMVAYFSRYLDTGICLWILR